LCAEHHDTKTNDQRAAYGSRTLRDIQVKCVLIINGEMNVAKYVCVIFLFGLLPLVANAQNGSSTESGSFPCDAFQMQQDGTLTVVRPVTIRNGPNVQIRIGTGGSFGPNTRSLPGLNVYEKFQQQCH
jgi:hypothetical protein